MHKCSGIGCTVGCMAIDTATICNIVIGQKAGIEILKVTFANLQHVPYLISRLYQAVAEISVYAVG